MKQKQTVAQYVAEFLASKKLTDVFMVTGGGAMFLNDAFSRHKSLKSHCFHHEQACAMAGEAYFRVSRKPAIVNVTTGPGGTNAITGVYGAYVDSAAMIVVSGQVKRPTMKRYHSEKLRQLGDQEIDIVPMVKSITKYAVLLDDPSMVTYELEKSFHIATSGRPGPVWIDIPIDVQSSIMPTQKKKFAPANENKKINPSHLKKVVQKLATAKRPVIICGTGIHLSETSKELLAFATKFKIPVVSSFCASDVVPAENPLFIGRQGTIGDRPGNFAVQNADLVLILGARMNIRQVSYDWAKFAPNAFKIMVDIDNEELLKPTLKLDLAIHADLKLFFNSLNKMDLKSLSSKKSYLQWCQERKAKYSAVLPDYYKSKKINPYVFIAELSKRTPEETVIVTADAAAAITSFQAFTTRKGQRLFSNSGSAPMGFDLPGVIGASVAARRIKKNAPKTICLAGDGSIMMNLQELQTIKTLNLNVVIFLINNGGYLSILQTQKNYFKDNIFGCLPGKELGFPDFKAVTEAFGLSYKAIRSVNDMESVDEILKSEGPWLCEVFVDENQMFEPKLVSKRLEDGSFASPDLDDMYPFLSEKELRQNRISE